MDEAPSAPADAAPTDTAPEPQSAGEYVYPDKLDAATIRIAGVCVLASVMIILDATIVYVAQRTLIGQFGSSQAVVAWTMTGYTLALATVIPITGWAADRFGTKRLWMGSVLAFTLGSVLCATAPNMALLITFRVLQGFGGGMLLPLGYMIMTRVAGPKRLGRLMAVLSIPILLGPIGGPILGGWLIDEFGWRWIFLVNVPIGLTALVLAARMFPRDEPEPSETFDFTGVLLLSPGLATFLFGVSSIPGQGTVADRRVLVPAAIGLVLMVAFAGHVWHRADHPLIDLRLFNNRVFTYANASLLAFAVAFFGASLLLPSYFQQVLHQTPFQSGIHLIPQGIGTMMTMPFAGTFMDRRGPGKCVLLGLTLLAAGLAIFALGVATRPEYLPTLLAGLWVMGMGTGCTMVPLSGSALQTLTRHEIARGSTLITVNRQIGASIGTALMSVILTNQLNRSENVSTAGKLAALQQESARSGTPVDPSAIPPPALAPDFSSKVIHDLAHAYTVVLVLSVALIALTLIPAAFLPRKPATAQPATSPFA